MLRITILLLAILLTNGQLLSENFQNQWINFQKTYKKTYQTPEESLKRATIFQKNLEKITNHNQNPKASYTMAINEFADLEPEEFLNFMKTNLKIGPKINQQKLEVDEIPASLDWREEGVVTEIRNQGSISPSWAYAAITSIEAQYAIKYQILPVLNEQKLMDCIRNDGESRKKCELDSEGTVVDLEGFSAVSPDELSVKRAVALQGPVIASIFISDNFQFYADGIFCDDTCPLDDYNHVMAIIGYSNTTNQDYWIVRNSWGSSWGQDGYVLIGRTNCNNCGIHDHVTYAVIN